jgi:hypothetical protein
MAKLFGEFLVENNLATTEQVLEAVITQLRSVKSTAELIFDHALLSPTDQLKILSHQQYSGMDFRSSASTLALWNSELATKVADLVRLKRRPLGEVLVELGFLSDQSLTQALEAYVESFATLNQSAYQGQMNSPAGASPIANPGRAQSSIKPILIGQFVKSFESQIFPGLNAVLQSLENRQNHQSSIAFILRTGLGEIVSLRAASSFVSAAHMERLAEELIDTFEFALRYLEDGNKFRGHTSMLCDIFKMAIHIFDGIFQLLKEFGSEDGIDADSNLIDLMQRLARGQELFRAECESARKTA